MFWQLCLKVRKCDSRCRFHKWILNRIPFLFLHLPTQTQKTIQMKKISCITLAFTVLLAFASCMRGSENEQSAEKPKNVFEALGKMGTAMANGTKSADEAIKARRAKGDTLAMHYTELQKFLPTTLAGYTAKEPNGSTVNMMGASYSNAEIRFRNGNDDVKITIIDYNQAYSIYSAATMMWTIGMSVDSPEERAGGIKFDNRIAGWETYRKKSKRAELTLGVGSRFWVQVEADNQENTDYVKSVAKSIDLDGLAGM